MESLRQTRERNLRELPPAIDSQDAMRLQQIARSLHKLDEASCNYGLTPRQEKRHANLEKEAQQIAQGYGFNAFHQSDPRGWSLYLLTPDIDPQADYTRGIAICPH